MTEDFLLKVAMHAQLNQYTRCNGLIASQEELSAFFCGTETFLMPGLSSKSHGTRAAVLKEVALLFFLIFILEILTFHSDIPYVSAPFHTSFS